MFTIDDVGPKIVNGIPVDLPVQEKQAIADEWNANLTKQEERLRNQKKEEARINATQRAIEAMIGSDTIYSNEIQAIDAMPAEVLIGYKPK